ncbi:MAG TPA: hypothetical protein VFF73_41065 [Planctomycetota bacterium]|nr:hypothetical protein [Planctomycetota bacterium]
MANSDPPIAALVEDLEDLPELEPEERARLRLSAARDAVRVALAVPGRSELAERLRDRALAVIERVEDASERTALARNLEQ